MAFSMTGWGIGEASIDGYSISVELKSVNNRFLEVSCRLPSYLSQYEQQVREVIKQQIHRGKVYMNLSIKTDSGNNMSIRLNPALTKAVRNLLNELRQASGVDEALSLDHFLHFSEIFESSKEPGDGDRIWESVVDALGQALKMLKTMRSQEGEALTRDILEHIRLLNQNLEAIEAISKQNVPKTYDKMIQRIKKLTDAVEFNEDRLNTEIVLMADRLDVTEECVRLTSHNQLFTQTLKEEEAVGKKLNFLLQEMNREANTISSKATDVDVSRHVVAMKEEIEKLREQVQNLE